MAWNNRFCVLEREMDTTAASGDNERRRCRMARPMEKASSEVKCGRMRDSSREAMEESYHEKR